jgi:hypothetical protein
MVFGVENRGISCVRLQLEVDDDSLKVNFLQGISSRGRVDSTFIRSSTNNHSHTLHQ